MVFFCPQPTAKNSTVFLYENNEHKTSLYSFSFPVLTLINGSQRRACELRGQTLLCITLNPLSYTIAVCHAVFFISLLLPFGEKETEPGSQNCLNSPNDMKVMKVIRAMLPWTSRPIMACLTFTQPLKACELWCLPLCVSVSASRCLSQRCNSMSNSVSAHTTGLREQRD